MQYNVTNRLKSHGIEVREWILMEDELVPDTCFEGHEFTVWSLAFTPDGRYIVSGGQDATVRVWDLQSGSQVHKLSGHRGAVYGLSVLADGARGVSVADVETMKSQIIATDPVAADTAAAKIFGLDPNEVGYIKIAQKLNVGTMDLSTLSIKKISL